MYIRYSPNFIHRNVLIKGESEAHGGTEAFCALTFFSSPFQPVKHYGNY